MAARRSYTMRKRASQVEETRRRITEAAVELHSTVGPARTTVTAIAERAGVQRLTVYQHFRDETAILMACQSHWLSIHPPPDLGSLVGIPDPRLRLEAALPVLYDYLNGNEGMVGNLLRDARVSPLVADITASLGGMFQMLTDVLVIGWQDPTGLVRKAIGHAVAFETWYSLVRVQGLDSHGAARLMVSMVLGAAGPGSSRRRRGDV